MAAIALALISYLPTVPTVANIIGNVNGTVRLYPDYDPEADRQYPLCVYTIENNVQVAFDGPAGIDYPIVRLTAVAETYAQATQLADALLSALNGQHGTWGGVTVQGVWVQDDGIKDGVTTLPETEEVLHFIKELNFDAAVTS